MQWNSLLPGSSYSCSCGSWETGVLYTFSIRSKQDQTTVCLLATTKKMPVNKMPWTWCVRWESICSLKFPVYNLCRGMMYVLPLLPSMIIGMASCWRGAFYAKRHWVHCGVKILLDACGVCWIRTEVSSMFYCNYCMKDITGSNIFYFLSQSARWIVDTWVTEPLSELHQLYWSSLNLTSGTEHDWTWSIFTVEEFCNSLAPVKHLWFDVPQLSTGKVSGTNLSGLEWWTKHEANTSEGCHCSEACGECFDCGLNKN